MIKVRIRVSGETGDFTVVVCAESLRKAEQTAKAGCPGSTVSIVFPIESDCFFVSDPHHGGHVGLETSEEQVEAGGRLS
jgi:hypothetical protein